MRQDECKAAGRSNGETAGSPLGKIQIKTGKKGTAKAFSKIATGGILIIIIAFALSLFASCAAFKKPAYKHLPPGERKKPEVAKPAEAPKQAPEAVRTNARPSTEDVITPKRQASMRLVERGKGFLEGGELDRAVLVLRDAINVDSSNGVAYYYLASADVKLGQTSTALGLLDKAEALLGADNEWMRRIDELRGELGAPASKPVPSPIDVSF